jgi:DNA-binding transcriptional LysR family regulator
MELRQLRYFLAVADELHFGRAAERLLITTPSLSQQIKALERQLRLRLFDRSSTGVALTEHGAALLPVARSAVSAAEDVLATARGLVDGRSSVLRIGFQAFAWTEPVRELLAAFAMREPGVDVQLRQYEWDDPAAGLLDGEVDLALVRPPFRGAEALRTVELTREALLMVVRDGHPLARRARVTAGDVAGQPFLESPRVTDPVFAAFWYLRDIGTARPQISRATTVEEWLGEIALGRGVNLIPESFAGEYRRAGLAYVPVEGLPFSSVVLAWRAGSDHPAAQRLARFAARDPLGAARPARTNPALS